MMTVIDVDDVEVVMAAHAPMVDHEGLLINDPILLHVGASEWGFSIADRDSRLWIDATARASDHECCVLRAGAWSPRFETNLGLALVDATAGVGAGLAVSRHPTITTGTTVELPFDDLPSE